MRKTFAVPVALLILTSASLYAKEYTVMITIQGAGLTIPIEITTPEVGEFAIWAGPGVFHGKNTGEETEGFIIDWPKGIVTELPPRLQRYQVSFFTGCDKNELFCRDTTPRLTYVVSYAYDLSADQGYVYLPGRNDSEFQFNHAMYHGHGFEGHWLRATTAWEKFARPVIAKARASTPKPLKGAARTIF
jgi:hypothetical protein